MRSGSRVFPALTDVRGICPHYGVSSRHIALSIKSLDCRTMH
jgi:hypothetical protein